jgi:hypothetical protein
MTRPIGPVDDRATTEGRESRYYLTVLVLVVVDMVVKPSL